MSCCQQTAPPQSHCRKDVTAHPHRPGRIFSRYFEAESVLESTPVEEFIASIQEQIQLQQGQLLLQTQLLEARELIEHQAEMFEHGLRTVAQPAGQPGVLSRTQAGDVNQLHGVTWPSDWGREGGSPGVGFLDDVAERLRDDLNDLAPAIRLRLPSRKHGAV
jgi:hypothetical protein